MPTSRLTVVPVLLVVALAGSLHAAPDACRARASALGDAKAIAAVRGAIARQCPCASFDGSSKAKGHSRFVKCANAVIDDAQYILFADGVYCNGGREGGIDAATQITTHGNIGA